MKRYLDQLIIGLALLLVFIHSAANLPPVSAGTLGALTPTPQAQLASFLPDPSDTLIAQGGGKQCFFFIFCTNRKKVSGRTAQTGETGRRGRCSNFNLVALVPTLENPIQQNSKSISENIKNSIGFTISQSPTFWFYIPSLSANSQEVTQSSRELAEFMLQDANGKDVFDSAMRLLLPDRTGITGYTLPSEQTRKMQPNQPYHWYFSVICDPRSPSRNPTVHAWIQRENTFETNQLEHKLQMLLSDSERIELYAEKDLWYDAVTSLVRSHCNKGNGSKLSQYWANLLQEVGLGGKGELYCNPEQTLKKM